MLIKKHEIELCRTPNQHIEKKNRGQVMLMLS